MFRLSVYKLLVESDKTTTSQAVAATVNKWVGAYLPQAVGFLDPSEAIAKAIPASWVKEDGKLLMKSLVRAKYPKLGLLDVNPLTILLNNHDNACEFITLGALESLNWSDLMLVSPTCINAIDGLGTMDLSRVVGYLRKDAFAEYNGSLSMETIRWMSFEQVENYGSLVKDTPICTSLELHYLGFAAARGTSFECLCGYLGSQREAFGL